MAKKSWLELRKEVEAADARGIVAGDGATKKKAKEAKPKKKAAARPRRSKTKAIIRKRLVWGVFSSSLKEEARFPYADREAADAKASDLALKYKRTYFVQPIKEPLPERETAETAK